MEQHHCRIHLEMGELCRINKQYSEAKKHLEEAEELSKRISNSNELLFWIRLTQARIAHAEGDQMAVKTLLTDAKELADTPDKIEALKNFS